MKKKSGVCVRLLISISLFIFCWLIFFKKADVCVNAGDVFEFLSFGFVCFFSRHPYKQLESILPFRPFCFWFFFFRIDTRRCLSLRALLRSIEQRVCSTFVLFFNDMSVADVLENQVLNKKEGKYDQPFI